MILSASFLNRLKPYIMAFWLLGCAVAAQAAPAGPNAASPEGWPRIAVFPIENLSGTPAPLKELGSELLVELRQEGMRLIEPGAVDDFIETHQVRYLGGIDEKTAAILREATGADAVLITTLELYSDVSPPKFSIIARLVSIKDVPEIIWMDSVGIAGDDSPGILGLGLIDDIKVLRGKGLKSIGKSLKHYVTEPPVRKKRVSAKEKREEEPFTLMSLIRSIVTEKRLLTDPSNSRIKPWYLKNPPEKPYTVEDMLQEMKTNGGMFVSRYSPPLWYSSQDTLVDQERTLAIIPFFNRSTRKHAAELQVLHLAKQLVSDGSFRVLELGVIRDRMLNMHVVMKEGISIPNVDLITIALGVDLLLNGEIFDYLDTVGYGSYPKIDFSMQMFDRDNKKILWSSHSHNQGDDGVYFFEYGRIATASALSDRMCRALVLKLVENANEE
jgi:hypothetical protein